MSFSGSTQITSAAASGSRIRTVVIGSLDRHKDDGEDGDAGGDRERVRPQEPGLRARDEAAEIARVVSELARRVGDQRLLDPASESLRGPDGRPVEEGVAELVEVELVLEHALREREARYGNPARAVDQPGHVDAAQAEGE